MFIACNMSAVSGPRHSPMMSRSGRMRSAFFTRSRSATAPPPSGSAGSASILATCRCCSCNSAVSSIVTTRSESGMNTDKALSKVVLPAPVPPETMRLMRALTQAARKSSISGASDSLTRRSWAVSGRVPKRRIDTSGPLSAGGLRTMFKRLPSGSRASTMRDLSSIERPEPVSIRRTTCNKCSSSSKAASEVSSRPRRSKYSCRGPLMKTSVISWSRKRPSMGP